MDINITQFFKTAPVRDYSASVMEIGNDAGPSTWRAACADAADWALLNTPEELQALRDHVRGFGAWEAEEIAAWSDTECNALFIQLISGDIREIPDFDPSNPDWEHLRELQENGTCGARLSADCDSGEVWYYLGD